MTRTCKDIQLSFLSFSIPTNSSHSSANLESAPLSARTTKQQTSWIMQMQAQIQTNQTLAEAHSPILQTISKNMDF